MSPSKNAFFTLALFELVLTFLLRACGGIGAGEFVDDYTINVVDVFAMPQSGTGVSVEAVDPVFQTKMLDMLKQVGDFSLPSCVPVKGPRAKDSPCIA